MILVPHKWTGRSIRPHKCTTKVNSTSSTIVTVSIRRKIWILQIYCFRALYVRRNSTKWCEWQLVQWWQWNVHLTPLLIWKLLTNHHWVVAWLLLDANCPVLLPRGGISLKGLTAQWLQQFASCTELCKYPFVQWCHEAMNQSFNPQHLARDKFPNAQIYSRVHVYIRTYVRMSVCILLLWSMYVHTACHNIRLISFLQNDRTTK